VSRFVIDASIAIKWVIPEPGTAQALTLLKSGGLAAPDLIVAECANILWKKTQRAEIAAQEAMIAAHLITQAQLEILPTRALLSAATDLAIKLSHPAHDCLYLALALDRGMRFVTADERFLRTLGEDKSSKLAEHALSLSAAAAIASETSTPPS
jgi:predicted nucleic acid-binding protein